MSSDIPKTGFLKGEKDDSGERFKVKLNVHQGFHPRHVSFPQNAITPQTGNTSLSKSAGAVEGGQALSPPSSLQCFVFHVRLKEFSRAKKSVLFLCIWQEETASRSRVSAGSDVFLVIVVHWERSVPFFLVKPPSDFLVNLNYLL
jgi:hypothetical protein